VELTKQQKDFYKTTLETTEKEYKELELEVERELAAVKERLNELQARKKQIRQIYDAACAMLKVENKLSKLDKSGGAEKKQEL